MLLEDIGYYDTMEKVVTKISGETGIPSELIDFYEYNTMNNYYYKYRARYVRKDEYNKTIQSLFEKVIESKESISFYVHVNHKKLALMEYNELEKRWRLKKNVFYADKAEKTKTAHPFGTRHKKHLK